MSDFALAEKVLSFSVCVELLSIFTFSADRKWDSGCNVSFKFTITYSTCIRCLPLPSDSVATQKPGFYVVLGSITNGEVRFLKVALNKL